MIQDETIVCCEVKDLKAPRRLFSLPDAGDAQKDPEAEPEVEGQEVGSCGSRCPLKMVLRLSAGLVLAGCVSGAWAGAALSAKQALTQLHAPFFIIWFCSVWNLLFFPLFYLGHLLASGRRQGPGALLRSDPPHSPLQENHKWFFKHFKASSDSHLFSKLDSSGRPRVN